MFRFGFILLLAFLSSFSLAQPDPTTIFVDGIQYEEYQAQSTNPTTAKDDRLGKIDHQTRMILIRASIDAPWQEFPFPEGMDDVQCLEKRSDGTWFVQQWSCDVLTSRLTDNDRRILYTDTGVYSAPELICQYEVKSLPGEGYWVYTQESETQRLSLCFTETGELRDNLPDATFWFYNGEPVPQSITPHLSPDRKYLLLRLYPKDDRQESVEIYSYELATSELHFLGEIQLDTLHPSDVRLSGWLDDTHGVLMMYGYSGLNYYGFDLTQSDSLEYALKGFDAGYSTLYYDESARRYESIHSYRQVSSVYGSRGEPFPCTLYIYDVNGAAKYELADHCLPLPVRNGYDDQYTSAYRIGNRYYYLAVSEGDESNSVLRYFDLTTMSFYQPDLWGEIESIGSVSPDGRYVLVEVGSDLELDNLNFCCQDKWGGMSMMVYDTEIDPDSDQDGIVYVTGPAAHASSRWLDNQTLLFNIKPSPLHVENRGYGASQNGYELLKINADNSTTVIGVNHSTVFETYSENISPDGTYMLFQQGVLNPQTFEYTPIIRENPPDYQYQVSWEADDMIVSVFPSDYVYESGLDPLTRYRIKLP